MIDHHSPLSSQALADVISQVADDPHMRVQSDEQFWPVILTVFISILTIFTLNVMINSQ